MTEITFDALMAAIARPRSPLSPGNKLQIPEVPRPFVAPPLQFHGTDQGVGAEVLFIEASAAVGKSTTARYLAGTLGIPLLDLAKVAVGTGSLKALLMDVTGAGQSLQSFHAGELPVIVDALDEGRLHSGEASFDSFLLTTGELLMESRTVANRPKLIFFGRYEATSLAETGIQLAGDVSTRRMEVGFFNRQAAWDLIYAYADISAAGNAPYRQHPGPARQVIQAYFNAIETALGLGAGALWSSEQGKAFAGYAPVLAAVGSLLAEMDNFPDVANRLRASAAQEAWGVIETVLDEIIKREQRKLTDQLAPQIAAAIPPEAYDGYEQLSLLSQYVHGQPLQPVRRLGLAAADFARYQSMVQIQIREHPFVRQREFGNDVLGSVVIAHAIIHDLLQAAELDRCGRLSRQPFVWRAFAHRLASDSLIDGRYVGYVLNSLWNDRSVGARGTLSIRSSGQDSVKLHIPTVDSRRRVVEFSATVPVTLYSQIKDCDADISASVQLIGDGPRNNAVFFARGNTTLICSSMELIMDSIRFDGQIWLEADDLSSPAQLKVHVNGARVGWGGQFTEQYPWNGLSATLTAPYVAIGDSILDGLVLECCQRLPPNISHVLNPDFTAAEDDPYMRWVNRRYSSEFPALVRLMIKHNLASSERIDASGMGKVKIRFRVPWTKIQDALGEASDDLSIRSLVAEARTAIH